MNGAELAALALRLAQALEVAGIRVCRPVRQRVTGHVRHEPADAQAVLGTLLRAGFTIEDCPRYTGARRLQLERDG